MGNSKIPDKVMLTITVISRHHDLFNIIREQLTVTFGNLVLESSVFPFDFTDYYTPEMGKELQFKIFCFKDLISPEKLVAIKNQTNNLELEISSTGSYSETRPINLDPGYVSLHKFVLASTKDTSYRVYLNDGIYAEITLTFSNKAWLAKDWTYPNYNLPEVKEFLSEARECYLKLRN